MNIADSRHITTATELLKYLDVAELDIFTLNELQELPHLNINNLQETLESLVNRGLLSRIEKGKFCKHTFRNEYVISNYLVTDGVVAYWSALNLYGLTEQFSNVVFVQSAKQKKDKTVFGVRYQFVKVKPTKMVGTSIEGFGNHQFSMTDIEKTLVDCFDLPQYSGGFVELIRAFAQAELNPEKLIAYSRAIKNISAVKRMAFIAEVVRKPNFREFLAFAQRMVNLKYNLMDPFGQDEGGFNSKWKLRLNLSEAHILDLVNKQY